MRVAKPKLKNRDCKSLKSLKTRATRPSPPTRRGLSRGGSLKIIANLLR